MDKAPHPQLVELGHLMVDGSPHAVHLGLKLEAIGDGHAQMRAPYNCEFVGDPDTGVIHGGVVTALLDHVCGLAAFAGFGGHDPVATLDLRLDYMRPAQPGADIIAEAHCVKTSGLIAFVRASAHDGDPDNPVALAQSTFMVTRASQKAVEKAKALFKGDAQ